MKGTIRRLFGRTSSEQCANIGDLVDDVPRGKGASAAQGCADAGRTQLEDKIIVETQRRNFLRMGLVGAAGAGALGFLLTHRASADLGDAQGGTHIDPNDIVSKRIAGVRIATEFDTAKHAGTDGDPWLAAAIASAISDIPVTGGITFVPSGVWNETATITIPKYKHLEGVGHNFDDESGTELRLSANTIALSMGRDSSVRNLRIRKSSLDQAAGSVGIQALDVSRVYVENVRVSGPQKGLYLPGGLVSTFRRVYLDYCRDGLVLESGASNSPNLNRYYDCNFTNNVRYGVNAANCYLNQWYGCQFETNDEWGFTAGSTVSNALLSGCHFERNNEGNLGTGHIKLNGSKQTLIVAPDLHALNFGTLGIYIVNAPDGTTIIGGNNDGGTILNLDGTTNRITWIMPPGTLSITNSTGNRPNLIGPAYQSIVKSSTFTIDSTGIKTVTIAHGLVLIPNIEDCLLTVLEETNVDDWAYNLLKVDSVDATNVTVKINVSTASGTGAATARIGLRVGKP